MAFSKAESARANAPHVSVKAAATRKTVEGRPSVPILKLYAPHSYTLTTAQTCAPEIPPARGRRSPPPWLIPANSIALEQRHEREFPI